MRHIKLEHNGRTGSSSCRLCVWGSTVHSKRQFRVASQCDLEGNFGASTTLLLAARCCRSPGSRTIQHTIKAAVAASTAEVSQPHSVHTSASGKLVYTVCNNHESFLTCPFSSKVVNDDTKDQQQIQANNNSSCLCDLMVRKQEAEQEWSEWSEWFCQWQSLQ